ncbi:unnamed protein product [Paramecium pentaurelia]|uniref:Uncharacterized protein n=1 Tax=Paramecium pentaurelia TaxID=43138 RepID=A0A8S1SXF5_9CILI|nr:unnamed protein product [Paramecium pentaurelia]
MVSQMPGIIAYMTIHLQKNLVQLQNYSFSEQDLILQKWIFSYFHSDRFRNIKVYSQFILPNYILKNFLNKKNQSFSIFE